MLTTAHEHTTKITPEETTSGIPHCDKVIYLDTSFLANFSKASYELIDKICGADFIVVPMLTGETRFSEESETPKLAEGVTALVVVEVQGWKIDLYKMNLR